MVYVRRTLEGFIERAASKFPALLLTGARQVGKTTLLKHIAGSERTFVTLDDPLVLNLARTDPALFIKRYRPPLLIDEIQYAPELLPYIKMEIDESGKPDLYWLTGSQQFHVMKGVSESLAGRVAILNLYGLSRMEISGLGSRAKPFKPDPETLAERLKNRHEISLNDTYRNIWRGSYPAIALDSELDRDLFYGSYVQTYLQRDVRDLARVGDENAFLRFLRAAAARTGQILNVANLAQDSDVAPNTARHWLSILQASGVVYLLEPYSTNLTKRIVKSPKLYFLDTGLCAYLTQWNSPETLEAGAMSGAIFETWVVSELVKSYAHNGLTPPLYYYRDRDKKEIDVLIVRDGVVHPLEIKKTASPNTGDIRAFASLERLGMKVGTGGVICFIDDLLPLTEHAWAIPWRCV